MLARSDRGSTMLVRDCVEMFQYIETSFNEDNDAVRRVWITQFDRRVEKVLDVDGRKHR